MSGWERLHALARRVEQGLVVLGRIAAWSALLLAGVIVFDVVLRRWFVFGSTRLQELEWHLHGALFLLTLGYAYLKGAHVRIEILHERWTPRTRARVEAVGLLFLLFPFLGALLWFGWDYVAMSVAIGERSPSPTGLPARWIIKGVMLAGIALLGLAGAARFVEAMIYLFGPASLAVRTDFARADVTETHFEEERI
ncbi:MAG: TRAP transporter small permease subunit [Alphaproteobacteria bacterium]|nr:MAG: TRAP transporter small permease subunit [Alphaproteobacteria bacterium]